MTSDSGTVVALLLKRSCLLFAFLSNPTDPTARSDGFLTDSLIGTVKVTVYHAMLLSKSKRIPNRFSSILGLFGFVWPLKRVVREPVIVPTRDPVIVPVLDPVIVPVFEPVMVPDREPVVRDPEIVPANDTVAMTSNKDVATIGFRAFILFLPVNDSFAGVDGMKTCLIG